MLLLKGNEVVFPVKLQLTQFKTLSYDFVFRKKKTIITNCHQCPQPVFKPSGQHRAHKGRASCLVPFTGPNAMALGTLSYTQH